MADMSIRCDRWQCIVTAKTLAGKVWMRQKVKTRNGDDFVHIPVDSIEDFKSELAKGEITYDYSREG